jgi:hypothetical protein
VGANPAHPELWIAGQRAGYRRFMLDRFRAHWRRMIALDYPAMVRAQSGRAALINEVRLELAHAIAPPPSQPWRHCRCHPMRFHLNVMTRQPEDEVRGEDLIVWRARDRATRAPLSHKTAVALCYLEQFRPRGGGHP